MYYGVATISRLLKIIGLFCKRALWKRRYSAKETYNFKEPTNRSHPIRKGARDRESLCENVCVCDRENCVFECATERKGERACVCVCIGREASERRRQYVYICV